MGTLGVLWVEECAHPGHASSAFPRHGPEGTPALPNLQVGLSMLPQPPAPESRVPGAFPPAAPALTSALQIPAENVPFADRNSAEGPVSRAEI